MTKGFSSFLYIGWRKNIDDKTDIFNTLNTFFASVSTKLSHSIKHNGTKTVSSFRLFLYVSASLMWGKSIKILLKTVLAMMPSTDPFAMGYFHAINQFLCNGVFPDRLKIARVVPLFKKCDQHILDNYRPIFLLPVVSKVFQKVVFYQLYQYVTDNNIIFTSQCGFRKLHSTELSSLILLDRVFQYLDQGKLPLSIFLDLSKAFDTLDDHIRLDKLEYRGITNTPLKWFESYLHGRKQYVDFE